MIKYLVIANAICLGLDIAAYIVTGNPVQLLLAATSLLAIFLLRQQAVKNG